MMTENNDKAVKPREPRRQPAETQEMLEMYGSKMSFAAKEAYKLLRTNLIFALSEASENRGHVVGMTSALRGEGKSTTTINLASVIAEQGMKVIIVEADLRLPSLQKKIRIRSKLGLSNVLIRKADPMDYVQQYTIGMVDEKPISFDVLVAGAIPPNPSELLGSKRMAEVLDVLAEHYDFVLLDLPPVTAVTDALVATKLVDGIVMVVRNEYADMGSLNEAIRQIQLVDGKILGFVYTCATSGRSGYRRKYKYHKYYNYKDYKDYKDYK